MYPIRKIIQVDLKTFLKKCLKSLSKSTRIVKKKIKKDFFSLRQRQLEKINFSLMMDILQRARFSGLAVGLAYGIGLNKNLKSHKNSKNS